MNTEFTFSSTRYGSSAVDSVELASMLNKCLALCLQAHTLLSFYNALPALLLVRTSLSAGFSFNRKCSRKILLKVLASVFKNISHPVP